MTSPEVRPDSIDISILRLLRENARRSLGDIGGAVGLSAPAVHRRIAKLEQSGVIQGYTAIIDHAKLGRPLEAFTEIRFSGRTRVNDIESIGADIPEIEAIFTIAGDPDALVSLRVKDVQDLKRVIDRLRASGQVVGTKTLMVLGASRRRGL